MNLLPMQYFLTVIEYRSISKAAKASHVTQQTMSAHMASLEQELGCILFQRSPRFQLTYEGRVFERYCRQFAQLSSALEEEFSDIRHDEGGMIRVGIGVTRGRVIMPQLIERFRNAFPHVTIELEESQNDRLVEMLMEGSIDVMIGRIPGQNPEYLSASLYTEQLVLAASKELVPDDVATQLRQTADLRVLGDAPYLLYQEQDIAGSLARKMLRQSHVVPRIAVQSDSASALIELARRNMGVCFCPDALLYACAEEATLSKLHLIPLPERYQVSVAWSSEPYTNKRISAFVEMAKEMKPPRVPQFSL